MDSSSPGCLPFLAAAAAAALAAPFAFGATELLIPVVVIGFVLACLHVVFLAVPIYLWLEGRFRPTPAVILSASALIGMVPILIILIPSSGWRDMIEPVRACGLCGIAGGLGFWLTLRLSGPAPP